MRRHDYTQVGRYYMQVSLWLRGLPVAAHDPLLTINLLLIHVPLIGSGSNAPPALALRRAGAGPGVAGAS